MRHTRTDTARQQEAAGKHALSMDTTVVDESTTPKEIIIKTNKLEKTDPKMNRLTSSYLKA
jgi:hypothetical protein